MVHVVGWCPSTGKSATTIYWYCSGDLNSVKQPMDEPQLMPSSTSPCPAPHCLSTTCQPPASLSINSTSYPAIPSAKLVTLSPL